MLDLLITIAAFIVAIAVLVTIHEFGHFWVARRCGVKVIRFSVGFGKPLYKYVSKVDGTEYVIAAIPLGGFVSMLGETDKKDDGDGNAENSVTDDNRHQSLNGRPLIQRMAIVLAGPFANFIFAIFAMTIVFMMGMPGIKPIVSNVVIDSTAWKSGFRAGDKIVSVDGDKAQTWGQVRSRLITAMVRHESLPLVVAPKGGSPVKRVLDFTNSNYKLAPTKKGNLREVGIIAGPPATVKKTVPKSPAEKGGLLAGDKIVKVNNILVYSFSDMSNIVSQCPNKPLAFVVQRAGQLKTFEIIPAARQHKGKTYGRVGVYPEWDFSQDASEKYSVGTAFIQGSWKTWDMSLLTFQVFGKMITGNASLKNISGPVTIADVAGKAARRGLDWYLYILAIISLSLGVINLLPIPVLDGGHFLFYCIEGITGKPVSEGIRGKAMLVGLILIMALMSYAFYNDYTRYLGSEAPAPDVCAIKN